ncbi:TIM barrel protein [Patulibacter sp. S7RM1-6]
MTDYEHLAGRLRDAGVDVDAVQKKLGALAVEVPSWGFGDSGTRFATFQQPGRPRSVQERIDDAAEVHRLSGTAPSVALHIPWDAVDDYAELGAYIHGKGLKTGPINPNLFQDPDYKLGSSTNPDAAIRRKATDHLLECAEIARATGSGALSLWFADGTNYAGQDDLLERRQRLLESLRELHAATAGDDSHPPVELLVEYKLFEPAFYATDLPDWGSAALLCRDIGERAKVLVDLGHHAQGVNIEQIVAVLASYGLLGGFHTNDRRYADDDLITGSVNPFALFCIFVELAALPELPRITLDQSHNIESKVEAILRSVVNIQEAYAKALLVDREKLRAAQQAGDVNGAYGVLADAFAHDVRPLTAAVRESLGASADPIGDLRSGGYMERLYAERGSEVGVAGGWGR